MQKKVPAPGTSRSRNDRRSDWALTLVEDVNSFPAPLVIDRSAAILRKSDRAFCVRRSAQTSRIAPRWDRSALRSRSTCRASGRSSSIADLASRPSFTDHFLSDFHLTRIESSGVGAGARFRFDVPLRAVWMDTTIVEFDEPHRIVEHGRGGRVNRIPSTTVWELTEGPGSLTKVRVSYWTEPRNPVDRAKEMLGGASSGMSGAGARRCGGCATCSSPARPPSEPVAVAGGNRYATGIP